MFEISNSFDLFFLQVWFSNRRAKYRREDKVKGRRQHQPSQQLMNDMGENMRPSGATPPLSLAQQIQPSSSSSLYPQVLPPNNDPNNHPHAHHHPYGAFGSGFTGQMAAAVACSSSGYPTFFPSKLDFYDNLIILIEMSIPRRTFFSFLLLKLYIHTEKN